MAPTSPQPWARQLWALARTQHSVVTRAQLVELGLSPEAIQHRIERGRLHPLHRGVYALGRPQLDQLGTWMAAVLRCGPEALLGYGSAAALLGIAEQVPQMVEIVVPSHVDRRPPGIRVHRRAVLRAGDRDERRGVPVTGPAATLIDCASRVGSKSLEAMVNAADRLDLIDPEALLREVEATPSRPGRRALRELLDRQTFARTDSELERRFLRLVRSAGLPFPQTQVRVNGYRVDFYWPELRLVIETDGLRYHRTPNQQARDLRREQVHAASGLTALRFPAAQVFKEPTTVEAILHSVIARLRRVPGDLCVPEYR